MDYNTQRKQLVLPEYGRHLQQMVNQLLAVEDRDERNKMAKAIIAVMGNMNPHLRDINDFKHKLWDHLHIMAEFKLDIDSPYPKPDAQTIYEKPKAVPYPSNPIRYKHYGRSISRIIEKAVEMEDGPQKDALVQMIANQMKKSYLAWNKDSVLDDDIVNDMKELSGGKLSIPADFKFVEIKEAVPAQHNKSKKKFQRKK